MNFFDGIEYKVGPFQDSFFDDDFLPIVKRHRNILKKRLKEIYAIMSRLDQTTRSKICEQIRESNDIEAICKGTKKPIKLDDSVNGLKAKIRDLFIALYKQVLDGKPFNDQYDTNLREHFDGFSELNDVITLCPICGISELKKKQDKVRDQYDHYLPKSIYPLSSVNFDNLVPTCRECNSLEFKGDIDVIEESTGKLFFPYNNSHKGIKIDFQIAEDKISLNEISWEINFSNPDGKQDEIDSWKEIYDIESRYEGFVMGRIEKWYRFYWEYINDSDLAHLDEDDKKLCCMKALEKDESLELSFIRKPALECFLNESVMAKAELESKLYS